MNAIALSQVTRLLKEYPSLVGIKACSSLPTASSLIATAVLDGKIYRIGGQGDPSRVAVFDPNTNSWTNKNDFPIGIRQARSGVIAGELYVGIGRKDSPLENNYKLWRYDQNTDSWVERATYPQTSNNLAGGVVNGKFYVITQDITYEYDPIGNSWTNKNVNPRGGGSNPGVLGYNGKLYAFWTTTAEVTAYDPVYNNWTSIGFLKIPPWNSDVNAVTVDNDGIAYLMGGYLSGYRLPLTQTINLNTGDVGFLPANLPIGMSGISAAFVNNRLYAVGGSIGAIHQDDVSEFSNITPELHKILASIAVG